MGRERIELIPSKMHRGSIQVKKNNRIIATELLGTLDFFISQLIKIPQILLP